MNPDLPVEKPSGVVPVRVRTFRIKSLMIGVALVALGLGWVLHIDRTGQALRADQAVFAAWMVGLETDHPSLRPVGTSATSSGTFFEVGRQSYYLFKARSGQLIRFQADVRSGPFHTDRRVIFESPDRTVTWPFEEIERGRKLDLKAEFPEAFR